MKPIYIFLGIAALGVLAVTTAKAGNGSDILITDHDAAYDYLLKADRWYTRRKGNEEWIDMEAALTPENYALAVSRLTAHLNR
jgi:hypothetical protein